MSRDGHCSARFGLEGLLEAKKCGLPTEAVDGSAGRTRGINEANGEIFASVRNGSAPGAIADAGIIGRNAAGIGFIPIDAAVSIGVLHAVGDAISVGIGVE